MRRWCGFRLGVSSQWTARKRSVASGAHVVVRQTPRVPPNSAPVSESPFPLELGDSTLPSVNPAAI